MSALEQAAEPVAPVEQDGPLIVRFDHVTHWYGNVVAVNDISLELGPGVTGLLGPNGAGKSTILHLLSGFLSPSRGSVTTSSPRRSCTSSRTRRPRRNGPSSSSR